MKIKLILAMLLVSPLVFGQAVKTFTWTPPIANVDGSPLIDADIASYNIYCNATLLSNVPNSSGTDIYVSGDLPAGVYDCYATTMHINGEESADSNSTNFTVNLSVPGAPTGFTVILP